ncbi:MAG: hypothetical protein ABIJ97_04235, partial [Bacteroidota bacterium]
MKTIKSISSIFLKKYDKIISLGIALMTMFFLPSLWEGSGMRLLGQNNALIINEGYTVLNGGTSSKPIYLVISQNSTQGIVRTNGHIISEGQYNYVKWDAGTTTGNYVFPLGVGTADYIPFTFNKTSTGNSSISLSSWATSSQNMPHPDISNVAAVSSMTCTTDSVSSAIDRFWDIQSTATADLTFSYRGSENTTTVPGDTLKAQHWNGTSWDAQAGPGNPGVTAGIGTVGSILGQTTFSPWVLTSALRVIASATPSTICLGSSIQLDASTIGGSGTYIYTWESVPAGFSSSIANPVVSPTVNTTYYVTVSNCATNVTSSISVTVNALPVVDAGFDQTVCEGTSVTLSGSGASSYTWDNGVLDGTPFTPTAGSLTYTVTGTTGGCSNTDQVVVTVNALPPVNAGVDQTVCEGTSVTLSGSGASSYTWNNGVLDGNPFTPAVGTLTYTVTGTTGSCSNIDQVVVTVNALPIATIISSNNPSVCGASDGSTTAGGGISYIWNTIPVQNSATASSLAAGTYTVTVSDGNCSSSTSVTLTDPSAPTVTLSSNDTTICAGSSVTFTAGGANDYEFFVNGASQGTPSPVNIFTTSSLIDGDIVTVDGTNSGCTGSSPGITFIVSALPNVEAGVDQTVCEGTSVTLSGSGASSYTWNNGVFDGTPFTPAVGSLTYTVTGTTGGCSNTDQVVVTVNASPIVSFIGLNSVYCGAGDPILLTGNHAPDGSFTGVDVTDLGNGTAGYSHATTGINTVTYTYTDINGCTASDIQTVTVNPLP